MTHKLTIPCIETSTHLGCWPDEQGLPQIVSFFVEVEIRSEYKAIKTDEIIQAINYANVVTVLEKIAQSKKFNLVEHLCFEALNALSDFLISLRINGVLTVRCKKNKIPIAAIKNGVEFQCQKTIS